MRGIVKSAQKKRLSDILRERLVVGKGTDALGQPFQNRILGGESKLMGAVDYLGKPIKKGFGAVAAAPVNLIGNMGKTLLFGRKGTLGKYRGTRLRPVSGGPGKGLEEISRAEYNAIKAGKMKGDVVEGKLGNKNVYYKRRMRPGGIVGFAAKHPLITAGSALAALALMSSPKTREVASSLNPVKVPENRVEPATAKAWQGYQTGNTLKSDVWG